MKNLGISQKAIILNNDKKILALRRSETHPYKPHSWDLPGGDLDFGEDPTKGILREIKEEVGLEVEEIKPFDTHGHITSDGNHWITIAYSAQYIKGDIVLSYEHDKFEWIDKEEFLQRESSDKLKQFIRNLT